MGSEQMRIEFLELIYGMIDEILQKYVEVLKWVLKTHMNSITLADGD
jgi:hypothetical protein